MNLEFYILWFSVIFPLVYSPGPGNILCAISGAINGFRGSVAFIAGLNVSYSAYALLAGFGLGTIIQQYEAVFYYVQIAGCVYIFYLAAAFFVKSPAKQTTNTKRLTFADGALSQALNIKGISIVILMYSQFLDAEAALLPQVLHLSAMLAALNVLTHLSWALGGSWMVSKLASARAANIQNKIYAALLFGVAIWLFP